MDQIYQKFGAPEEVYGLENRENIQEYQQKATFAEMKLMPVIIRHMGTGRCQEVLQRMRDYLLSHQVEIHTTKAVEAIITNEDMVKGVVTEDGNYLYARWVVVAPGREGAEWLAGEARRLKIDMAVNPVDIGIRVELPAAIMEPLTQTFYEAKFIYYSRTFEDKIRTFCMNPHGEVVLENVNGVISVNGHTHAYKKTNNTNFALLVSKTFTEPFKEPIAYGKYVASLANLLGGGVIIQRLGDLLDGKRSTPERLKKGLTIPTLTKATPGDLSLVFPYRHLVAIVEMLKAIDKVVPGVFSRYTLLYGVEVKFYSSRLALTKKLETRVKNLFAVGDGAGVTRGLAQASASGVVAARAILNVI
ncbi:MAG: NAD(P)/FAD-dependent oxidoreductase [Peptococcaceae bacterium]